VEVCEKLSAGCDPVRKTFMMIGIALVFGLGAVFVAQKWLDRQSNRLRQAQVAPAAVATATIVVAAAPLRFGTELSPQHLREVPWPAGAIPTGAFTSIKDILDGKTRRAALVAMEEYEPLLKSKITGPGQRASLAAVIDATREGRMSARSLMFLVSLGAFCLPDLAHAQMYCRESVSDKDFNIEVSVCVTDEKRDLIVHVKNLDRRRKEIAARIGLSWIISRETFRGRSAESTRRRTNWRYRGRISASSVMKTRFT
jgi:hypothetical protein